MGCGKSTISKELAKRIKGEHFAIDRVLDDHNLTEDKEDGYISQKSFKKANKIACIKASELLRAKTPVIFDGNFYWKSQVEDLIDRLNFSHSVFTLKAPLEVCIDRDSQRKKPHGEMATKVVYEKSTEFDYGTLIDITKPLAECVDEIVSHLPKL